jgi:L-ribulokinase
MRCRYAIGVDFGTRSGRAVLVELGTGRELGTEVYPYAHGVIDEHLPAPDDDVRLEHDWALQDPEDYLRTLQTAVPALLARTGVDPVDVIGVGIAVTASTMLPTTADGTPLCMVPELRREPHSWMKLWKHHAAQPEADDINALARARGEAWLPSYGGRTSSEWFFPKSLQILREAPAIYRAAERLIEAADWVVWQLTGDESRNSCAAGYKAIWSKREGFPSPEYFGALDPGFRDVVDTRMSRTLLPVGTRAGSLSARAAGWTGLRAGTAVAVANVDAHVSAPAVTVTRPGPLVAIMGTSICNVLVSDRLAAVEGMCGVVEDGVIPGYYGYEAGQTGVGDIFAWFVEQAVPGSWYAAAERQGIGIHAVLEREAERLQPGGSGLLALDWWNGNRSILVDADLTGLLVGTTLATRPPEIYRALIEATAYGARMIIESFEAAGIPVEEIVACGGLPERNRLMMRIHADVTGRRIRIGASGQTPALGAAMFAAVAAGPGAGGYATIEDAAARMARLKDGTIVPDPVAGRVYDELFEEYRELHDWFGRAPTGTMKRLKAIRARERKVATA